jgi:hypothetical protein
MLPPLISQEKWIPCFVVGIVRDTCPVAPEGLLIEGVRLKGRYDKAMRMKVIDLRPPPACPESYRKKITLLAKIFIICTKKA